MTYRILVTGARASERTRAVQPLWEACVAHHLAAAVYALPQQLRDAGRLVVVHGACPAGGVDEYAAGWASRCPFTVPEAHPAEIFGAWPACGPKRNSHMVSLGANLCLGFPAPGSKGTWDCLRKAVDAGIPTRVHVLPGGLPR